MVTSLSWCSAIVVLSPSLMSASNSRGRRVCLQGKPRSTVRAEQGIWGIYIGFMSAFVLMRQKKGSRSRFVEDVLSLPRKLVVSRSGQGSRGVPHPSVPGSVRSVPSLPERRVARTSLRCCSNFWDKWTLAACDGFFRDENIIVREARSILYAVQSGESNYPPGRLLILSDNLALVMALSAKDAQTIFTLITVMRGIFASGFRTGFVLSF